jgi:hypothetical protein
MPDIFGAQSVRTDGRTRDIEPYVFALGNWCNPNMLLNGRKSDGEETKADGK